MFRSLFFINSKKKLRFYFLASERELRWSDRNNKKINKLLLNYADLKYAELIQNSLITTKSAHGSSFQDQKIKAA